MPPNQDMSLAPSDCCALVRCSLFEDMIFCFAGWDWGFSEIDCSIRKYQGKDPENFIAFEPKELQSGEGGG